VNAARRPLPLVGFPPIARPDARALVLGSMPSEESLRRGEYYGHPRNQFWDVVERLFAIPRSRRYAERTRRLAAAGVALWDVAHRCARDRSSDATIRDVEANDFGALLARCPRIRVVFFNGARSRELFERLACARLDGRARDLPRFVLPSTSPAHAALSFEQKLARWRRILAFVRSEPAADGSAGRRKRSP